MVNNVNLNNLLQMNINEVKSSPIYQQALRMTYGKTDDEINVMIEQLAKQKGVDLNMLKQVIGNK